MIIFFVLITYLILFNDDKIIKRLIFIYIFLNMIYNLYNCIFKKIIECADNLGDTIDYDKKMYDILNDNVLVLQDVNELKKHSTKFNDMDNKIQKYKNTKIQKYKNTKIQK